MRFCTVFYHEALRNQSKTILNLDTTTVCRYNLHSKVQDLAILKFNFQVLSDENVFDNFTTTFVTLVLVTIE